MGLASGDLSKCLDLQVLRGVSRRCLRVVGGEWLCPAARVPNHTSTHPEPPCLGLWAGPWGPGRQRPCMRASQRRPGGASQQEEGLEAGAARGLQQGCLGELGKGWGPQMLGLSLRVVLTEGRVLSGLQVAHQAGEAHPYH